MRKDSFVCEGREIPIYSLDTIVVGTGAAGYKAANQLYFEGQRDIAIVTEHMNAGTSRNTGSDKQTYYKLTLSGEEPDSVREMAATLFAGQCVDGDIALCEAALSAQCFLNLVDLGVPFPRNRYGEYIGYKTDHDPRTRATSVGPYTSRRMTECLEQAVLEKQIKIYDNLQVIKIIVKDNVAQGVLCINLEIKDNELPEYVVFQCNNIIYATGGPAGMYADSVYPLGHYGATGVAFEAGVIGKNLTEWQYGLASIKPRWNVSGTYMQVMPRFISTDPDGTNEREFLMDFFSDKGEMLSKVFLKGYQWPFDVRKVDGGSSIIDILVYIESCKNRRIFLDYRSNALDEEVEFKALSEESYTYLLKATACMGTPYERLCHMNMPAVEFYRARGVDLETERLEIALCAQHNNGGLGMDAWWKTNVEHFFAVGEVAASHGVYRPGGSALNAGQVGAVRAAQYIANTVSEQTVSNEEFRELIKAYYIEAKETATCVLMQGTSNVNQFEHDITKRMSQVGAGIRNKKDIEIVIEQIKDQMEHFTEIIYAKHVRELAKVYRIQSVLLCQYVYLKAMIDYVEHQGGSRGSALYTDMRGTKPYASLPDTFTFCLDQGEKNHKVQEVKYQDGTCEFSWREVRGIPEDDDFFENVWKQYRDNKNIY